MHKNAQLIFRDSLQCHTHGLGKCRSPVFMLFLSLLLAESNDPNQRLDYIVQCVHNAWRHANSKVFKHKLNCPQSLHHSVFECGLHFSCESSNRFGQSSDAQQQHQLIENEDIIVDKFFFRVLFRHFCKLRTHLNCASPTTILSCTKWIYFGRNSPDWNIEDFNVN